MQTTQSNGCSALHAEGIPGRMLQEARKSERAGWRDKAEGRANDVHGFEPADDCVESRCVGRRETVDGLQA